MVVKHADFVDEISEAGEGKPDSVVINNTPGPVAPSSGQTKAPPKPFSLKFTYLFSTPGISPFDQVKWEIRTAVITNEKGENLFEQRGVEFPEAWSQLATNVVTSKYFRGTLGTPDRESSVRQLIGRVVNTISDWGWKDNYFATREDYQAFKSELTHILLYQKASFNSPVWFNVGVEEHPQCSACFINSVEDSMSSILDLVKTEGMLFKYGSGAGCNLSPIRSSRELLAGGGTSSGPVSFMKGFDAFAGVIKSGGKTRRAAKMVILNADHPDIVDFINCKAREERKAWSLIEVGYDGSFNGEAYSSIFFQNSNNSVRVTDEFMKAALEDRPWQTHAVTTGEVMDTYGAKDLLHMIAEATHFCGDPGLQFDTIINNWNTCGATERIHASNPCSEYMFLNDTACNLASLNLLSFLDKSSGKFDVDGFKHAVRIMITAQDIIVDNASYPNQAITRNSHLYRPLGLGYANLGALLMQLGLPYDSDGGRNYAAAVTSLMTGEAYLASAELARSLGVFETYEKNKRSMQSVIKKHRACALGVLDGHVDMDLYNASQEVWDEALSFGKTNGYRNAQVSVLAPTGTIGFMMDCDTTGIEPDISIIKYKKLVGGGYLKLINQSVAPALKRLGYSIKETNEILQYIDEHETIEGAPQIKEEHLAVFDCAFKPRNGKRFISHMGHIKMMGAVQPFISGAISKTVNMPNECTVEDIKTAYIESWRHGLKAVSIYRDNSKRTQPLTTSLEDKKKKVEGAPHPKRRRLPDERRSLTHKFSIGGHEGYITVGMYHDGTPGEIFVVMAKQGSTISGLMDAWATSISMALQYGVPLKVLVNKFSHTRFEPSGFTGNKEIPIAKSIADYIFRWLGSKFLSKEDQKKVGIIHREPVEEPAENEQIEEKALKTGAKEKKETLEDSVAETSFGFDVQNDAPACPDCGGIMVRNGSCYKCLNCGSTSGCS